MLHAPGHGPSWTRHHIRHALSLGACSIGWSELARRIDYLRDRPAWRPTIADPVDHDDWHEQRGAYDAPTLTRRHHERIGHNWRRMCGRAKPLLIAPPRYLTWETFDHPLGDVFALTFHPDAAVIGHDGKPLDPDRIERVRHYVDTLEWVEARARRALNNSRLVVIRGDLQMSDRHRHSWSPVAMARRLDLRVWNVGLDYVLSDRRLRTLDRRVIHTSMDHPWMREAYGRA